MHYYETGMNYIKALLLKLERFSEIHFFEDEVGRKLSEQHYMKL